MDTCFSNGKFPKLKKVIREECKNLSDSVSVIDNLNIDYSASDKYNNSKKTVKYSNGSVVKSVSVDGFKKLKEKYSNLVIFSQRERNFNNKNLKKSMTQPEIKIGLKSPE